MSLPYRQEKLAQEGLDCLRICLMECCEDDKCHTAFLCNHDSHWDPAPSHSHERYCVFHKALRDTAWRMAQPLKPATLLDVFYATTILSIIERLHRGKPGPREFALTYTSIICALEKSDKTYRELCVDVHPPGLSLDFKVVTYLGPIPCSDFIPLPNLLPMYNSRPIAQELEAYLDLVDPVDPL